jgi:hypothetical protein
MATAAGFLPVSLIRRSAANTAGTSTNPAAAKRDAAAGAASAILTRYTANPSGLGAQESIQFNERIFCNLVSQHHDIVDITWDEDDGPMVGSGQLLALNLGGAALPAGTALDILLEWDER